MWGITFASQKQEIAERTEGKLYNGNRMYSLRATLNLPPLAHQHHESDKGRRCEADEQRCQQRDVGEPEGLQGRVNEFAEMNLLLSGALT